LLFTATKVIAARKDDKDHQSWTIQLAQLGTNQPRKVDSPDVYICNSYSN